MKTIRYALFALFSITAFAEFGIAGKCKSDAMRTAESAAKRRYPLAVTLNVSSSAEAPNISNYYQYYVLEITSKDARAVENISAWTVVVDRADCDPNDVAFLADYL